METINNDKEKESESELLYKRNKDKLSINKNFHTNMDLFQEITNPL